MDKRKIVQSGNTSFTLALPIDWVRKFKLKKGSEVILNENEFGDIVISSEDKKMTPPNEIITIKIDGKNNLEINNEIINAYFRDYKSIIFEGNDIRSKTDTIYSLIKKYIGLDIIDQAHDSLVIKNFSTLDKETSSRPLIKKMDFGIQTMMQLLTSFFNKGFNKNDLYELEKLNEQNERIYFLTRRIILKMIENPSVMKSFQSTFHQLSKDKVIAGLYRQISNTLIYFGRSFLYLEHKKPHSKKINDVFIKLTTNYKLLSNSMRYKRYSEAYQFLYESSQYNNKWETLLKQSKNPLILETICYSLTINDLLNNIALEIVE